MPNHVHSVLKPLPIGENPRRDLTLPDANSVEYHSLAAIMQSRKGYTAFNANQVLKRSGEFWAHESYDHWIRNVDEWQRIVAYVLNNPVKAGYVKHWQDWKWSYRREASLA